MTIEQFVLDYLDSKMVMQASAKEIVGAAKKAPIFESIKWNDDIDGYPDVLKPAILINLDAIAIEWIDENLPKAFYRPMFEN